MSDSPQYLGDRAARVRTLFGLPIHRKIRTGEKQVPWSGVFMLSMMWFTWGFNIFAGGVALTFTIRKYVNNPQVISLVMTVAGVIMLGPIISYLSDQIWTRAGRRRPFLIVAWLGGFLAMASFAFLPTIAGFINHGLMKIGLKPVGELLVLAVMIACYLKMWDGAAPLEPLFLECVPSHQRGRFWAIRNMLFSLAVMMFYQILWPMYDRNIDMFSWFGHPGVLYMTGEQSIYILASGLFFLTGLYLVFCVKETRMPEAPNKSFRNMFLGARNAPNWPVENLPVSSPTVDPRLNLNYEIPTVAPASQIPIIAFVLGMLKDVFLKTSNFPYYIVLIIPGIETMIWGNYNQLMQNDQFRYTKQAQADWAFPMQMMAVFVLPVFAGWYSDVRVNIRWWLRILMLSLSVASFVAMLRMLKLYSPQDIRALPSFAILSVLTALTTVSMVLLYIPTVETMLDFVGREHARAWVSLLTVVKSMVTTALLYIYIQRCQDQTPPILVWMLFSVVGSALSALMDTFIGPMIYDYMPPSQMGTINSGKGIIESLVKFCAANMGAWWIVFFSMHIRTPVHSKYDYTSMYILQFMLFVPAIIAKLYFIHLIAKDKMKKWNTQPSPAVLEPAVEDLALVAETGTR
jgi:hypothetical protein